MCFKLGVGLGANDGRVYGLLMETCFGAKRASMRRQLAQTYGTLIEGKQGGVAEVKVTGSFQPRGAHHAAARGLRISDI